MVVDSKVITNWMNQMVNQLLPTIKNSDPSLTNNDCKRKILEIFHDQSEIDAGMISREFTDEECEKVSDIVHEQMDFDPDSACQEWLAFSTDSDYKNLLEGNNRDLL